MVLSVLTLIMGGILVVQYILDAHRSHIILNNELAQRKAYVSQIINLEGKSLAALSRDYSFWDEMVDFTKTKNQAFSKNNIDTGIDIYNADGAWVYDKAGTLLYTATSEDAKKTDMVAPSLRESDFSRIKEAKAIRYYLKQGRNLLEVRAATIVSGDDPEHRGVPQGYWVVARLLDKEYVNNLQSLTGQDVNIVPARDGGKDSVNGEKVSFAFPLSDIDGRSIYYLRAASQVTYVNSLATQYQRDLLVFALSCLLFVIVILLALRRLVLQPLTLIIESIYQQKPDSLLRLTRSPTEFGDLAKTMMTFFEQKARIAKEEYEKTELQKINKEKGAFLSLAAHELASPVSNVRTFAEFLGMTLSKEGKNDETITLQIKRIIAQIKRVSMLIDDLRTASQGRADLNFNLEKFNFDVVIQEEVAQAAFSTEHELIFEGGASQEVYSDPERIGQLLSNLIRNATKYSPDAHQVIVRTAARNGEVLLEVQDFGVGIAPEDQEHLFEKYYRAPSVRDDFKGLGLGLSIVKQITDHFGGRIWVTSELGKGSVFHVALPIVHENEKSGE